MGLSAVGAALVPTNFGRSRLCSGAEHEHVITRSSGYIGNTAHNRISCKFRGNCRLEALRIRLSLFSKFTTQYCTLSGPLPVAKSHSPNLQIARSIAMAAGTLESEFATRVQEALAEARELHYYPNRFEQMLAELGAVRLAKKLIISGELQDGLKKMAKLGRKDLTLEALVLEPKFAALFTKDERQAAEWRLAQV